MWSYDDHELDKINKLHLRFLRYILQINNSMPIPMIYGETGEFPLDIII